MMLHLLLLEGTGSLEMLQGWDVDRGGLMIVWVVTLLFFSQDGLLMAPVDYILGDHWCLFSLALCGVLRCFFWGVYHGVYHIFCTGLNSRRVLGSFLSR